jgi:hypothetical protein
MAWETWPNDGAAAAAAAAALHLHYAAHVKRVAATQQQGLCGWFLRVG